MFVAVLFSAISWGLQRDSMCRAVYAALTELERWRRHIYFYKHAVPTGLKKFLKSSRFPRRIRFGWETAPTGLRTETVIF